MNENKLEIPQFGRSHRTERAAAAKEKERRKQLRSLLPRSKGLSSRAISAGFSPHRVSPMIYDVNLTKKEKKI
jgi:hypothetical protein